MSLRDAELWAIGDALFTAEEVDRINKFKIPTDDKRKFGNTYFARRPTENVKKWYADHKAKLASLERLAK